MLSVHYRAVINMLSFYLSCGNMKTIKVVHVMIAFLLRVTFAKQKHTLKFQLENAEGVRIRYQVVGMYGEHAAGNLKLKHHAALYPYQTYETTFEDNLGPAFYIGIARFRDSTSVRREIVTAYRYSNWIRSFHEKGLSIELNFDSSTLTKISLESNHSICLGGWSPVPCLRSQQSYTVEIKWADNNDLGMIPGDGEDIENCLNKHLTSSWNISARGRYFTFELQQKTNPDLRDSTDEAHRDIETIEKFYVTHKNPCSSIKFLYYVNINITYHTAHNIYQAFTTISSKRGESQEIIPRIYCKYGSVEPLCAHQVYVLRAITNSKNKRYTVKYHFVKKDNVVFSQTAVLCTGCRVELHTHIVGPIRHILIESASKRPAVYNISVFGRDWEELYDCNYLVSRSENITCDARTRRSGARDIRTICVLGASCRGNDYKYAYYSFSFEIKTNLMKRMYIHLTFRNKKGNRVNYNHKAVYRTSSEYVVYGKEFLAEYIEDIHQIDFTLKNYDHNTRFFELEMFNMTLHVANVKYHYEDYHGFWLIRNMKGTINVTATCLSNWRLEQSCTYLRYRVWVEIEDYNSRKNPYESIVLGMNGRFSVMILWPPYGETEYDKLELNAATYIIYGRWTGTHIRRVIIDDGRHLYTFHPGVNLFTTHRSGLFPYLVLNCPPGFTVESKCKEKCSVKRAALGCRPCHCAGNTPCDSNTGLCGAGKCEPRYMTPYCDWTCPLATFGDVCQFYQTNYSNNPQLSKQGYRWRYAPHLQQCKNYKYVCPYGSCKKSTDALTCADTCNAVYKYGENCDKKCHCLDGKKCDRKTGKCDRCDYRYTGEDCQKTCKDGSYLVAGRCTRGCHCADNKRCDVVTGKCMGTPCETDYRQEPDCNITCRPTCSKTCRNSHCENMKNDDCDSNRRCPHGCKPRFYGDLCEQYCREGKYLINGLLCYGKCNCYSNKHCDMNTGDCTKCDVRRAGRQCKSKCPHGRFWDENGKCMGICRCAYPDQCHIKTGICEKGGCLEPDIWSGENCQIQCSYSGGCKKACHCYKGATCNKITGACNKCDYRYYGEACQKKCRRGRYVQRQYNREECSGICRCLNIKKCFASTGQCDGPCKAGYKGDKCDERCQGTEFGQNCARECRCKNSDKCNTITGVCPKGCHIRFYTSSCDRQCAPGTYAIGKNARYCSGTCSCETDDGCAATNGHCESCPIGRRGDRCEQNCSNNTWGRKCAQSCGHCRNNEACDLKTGNCKNGCETRYIPYKCTETCIIHGQYYFKLDIDEGCTQRCLCELPEYCNVIGGVCMQGKCIGNSRQKTQGVCKEKCATGMYGENCDKHCTCRLDYDCDSFTGKCRQGCKPLYFGESGYCNKKCTLGKYRAESDTVTCSKKCYCQKSDKCYSDGSCETGGCKAGRMGTFCNQTCPKGKFGQNCDMICHCAAHSTCSSDNGKCTPNKCKVRYYGVACQKTCERNLYQINGKCVGKCYCKISQQCAAKTGICKSGGCRRNRKGNKCDILCVNTFGPTCKKKCHCVDGRSCDIDNGTCPRGCHTRYIGPSCQTTCSVGRYFDPPKCSKQCRCKNNESCGVIDGICNDQLCISARYSGLDCQNTCPDGKFQIIGECVGVCQCANNSECDIRHGECAIGGCIPGKIGRACGFDCSPGRFGHHCASTCYCQNDDPCDVTSGACASGCANGRTGETCQESVEKAKSTNNNVIWIGAGAVAFAICVIACLVGFAFKRRTKRTAFEDELTEAEILAMHAEAMMQEGAFPMASESMMLVDNHDDDLTETESVAPSRRRKQSRSLAPGRDDSRTDDLSQVTRSQSTLHDRSTRRASSKAKGRRRSSKSRDKGDDSRASESVTQSKRPRRRSRPDVDTESCSTAASGRSKRRGRRNRRD